MNDDDHITSEKDTNLMYVKKTGAIPKNTDEYSSHYLPSFYWDIIEKINKGFRVCIILRGLPGSGKSFLAKKIVDDTVRKNPTDHIISADDFFYRSGKYLYDISKLTEAHQTAQRTFFNRASKGYSPLIIDNTNMEHWEMFPYIQAAIQYSYHLEIIEPQTPWKCTASKLAHRNKHSVPMDKIKKMMDKYQKIGGVRDFVKNVLNLDIVQEPKIRNIPPYKPKPALLMSSETDIADFSFDINISNRKTSTETEQQQKRLDKEPLSWQKFNTELKRHSTFSWPNPTDQTRKDDTNFWNTPPPQVFEESWDEPSEKETTIKEKNDDKRENNKPQPQRKQRKNKKPTTSSPSETLDLKPHRRNCPNENQSFAQIRELYPNISDNCLWDFFEKCKGDAEWCADMLCDENLSDQLMETGEDLICNCFTNENDVSISKKILGNNTNSNNRNSNTKVIIHRTCFRFSAISNF